MYRPNRRIGLIVWAAATWLAAGCGLPPSRAEFLEKMAANNRSIARTMVSFRATLKPLSEGKNADAATVRNAYQDVVKAMEDARVAAAGMLLPPASNSAQGLLDAYKAYLDAEKEVVDGPLSQVVTKIEEKVGDDGRPTPDDRRLFINDRLKEVADKEKANIAPLEAAENTYDSEHNFQAVDYAQYLDMQKKNK